MKINTKILQGLKEAQEPKITLDQITELLSNLGFNIVKNETGVREPTASAYMEETVNYTKVAMTIDIADESTNAANLYVTIQTGTYQKVCKVGNEIYV